MQLSVRDLVEMFRVTEATVRRWVKYQELPAQTVAGQFRFHRVEVLDWAIAHQIKPQRDPIDRQDEREPIVSLPEALEAGGIYYQVPGGDQASALRAVVSNLPLPENCDRESLLRLFVAREAVGSTAVGDGIAVPHARRPIVLPVPRTLATLSFLKQPIAYDAPDGKPVSILFSVISPTVTAHVQLLARLARTLHDPGFRRSIVKAKPRKTILREARRVETAERLKDENNPRAA